MCLPGDGALFPLYGSPLFFNHVSETMLLTTVIYLLVSIMGAVRSQAWVGVYTTDTMCDTSSCCCINGRVVLERPTRNTLKLTSDMRGQCGGETGFIATVGYPTGYSADLALGRDTIRCTLSPDSTAITATNIGSPQCSGNLYKNGVKKRDANVMIPFVLLIVAFFLNYSKE